ncbi:MAX gene-associated protein isoform X2 [Channa argus]|uniref:MAX gene-associated protein isoform X2 n=1 Tax=Channa argus TaxID=215402 RepID=UPI002945E527|nr:hypothetical protein Q8A73_018638 [Channa argus]
MPETDSRLTPMEDHHTVEVENGSLTNTPSLGSLTTALSMTPPLQTTTGHNFTSETSVENKAVSMASTDCSSALSSPTEASTAKLAITPATLEGTTEKSPATSLITPVSDSLTCTGKGNVNISEPLPACMSPSTTFGIPELDNDFPAVLTFKGVSVTLENNSVWKQFYSCGTEMILTKQGRRMFPYCRYRLAGLDPERLYSLVLSIGPSDQYRYRWSTSKWEVSGPAEHQAQGLIRAFSHHNSPCKGSEWMGGLVSFYKLKLTNNSQDQDGHMILHSMHRYIPSLHVIPVPDGDVHISDQPVVIGPESMTFTFPQTVFMAVTTYQNFRITQLKINHNPFAKGFREDGNNSRLTRVSTETRTLVKIESQPCVLKPAEPNKSKKRVLDLSKEDHTVSPLSTVQETRLVLKPIMSTSANKDEPYVPCIRGNHALGELVLVQNQPLVEPKKENHNVSVTPELQQGFKIKPKALPMTPTSSSSTPGSLSVYHKRRRRRRRINRHWGNSRGREWKAVTASPTVVHSPSLTVAMQPELDDVEGLLFVSFTTKEALEVHIRDIAANSSSCSSVSQVSLTTSMQLKETVEGISETDEEKIARLEAILLQDLGVLKHRQVIHPMLQEVGLKLSSLDPTKSIDLQYLGVHLPLPPPNLPEQGNATALSTANKALPFISRTGKTSDITKIKGWRNKFLKIKETTKSTKTDGLQKNLSAFCSNMLDEYLESEAQQISERAAAFSTNPEGSVAYELPAKSSSYVKTLDSVLKQRKTFSKFPVGSNRPCPLSHKPLLYSALTSPPPPLASPANPDQASIQQSTASQKQPGAENASPESGYTRLSRYNPRVSQKPTLTCGHNQGMAQRPIVLTKFQFKLLQMETGALNEGLNRTQLTPDRLSVALSVILTKETLPSQVLKVVQFPNHKAARPECGQEFCRLGCVCSSLRHPNKGPLHCQRPECMFGCTCFKRRIIKQTSLGDSEHHTHPVYSMTNMEHVVQPHPGSHVHKLWNRNIQDVDPEPLFVPNGPQSMVISKVPKRSSVKPSTQLIREEDKDPVYKYLESMMTCARVREFNSKPPPVLTIEPKMADPSTATTATKLQKTTTDNFPKQYYRTVSTVKKMGKNTSQEFTTSESEARKQIQIQSGCEWGKDRKMVLDALCRRLNQNTLSQHFYVGPYSIRPFTKIFMRKPSGSLVTYRVHISKQSNISDGEEDGVYDSDEERDTKESFDGDIDAEEDEEDQIEESEMRFGITPFLSGVLPAGKLRARTKPLGCQAYGLIQVNGKSYNQARLLLGSMGSLHPANRLAAYITGRLNAPGKIFHKNSQKPDPTEQNNIEDTLHIKAAGTVVPPVITARKTNDLKTESKIPVQLFQPDTLRKGSVTLLLHSQNSSTINPVQSSASSQRRSVSQIQNSALSSPVSLTVSPSLKTPSFLGQSGTYSFRICPPANQSSNGQNLPGVTLPGGFTLIQLPKPGAKESESVNTTNITDVGKVLLQKDALSEFGQSGTANSDANLLSLDTPNEVKDLPSSLKEEPGSSFEMKCDNKIPSDESDEANNRQVQSNLDITSEDWSSISSDYGGDGDDDEETVDIETVVEVEQRMAIDKMKEAVTKALQQSRDSSDYFGSVREPDIQDEVDNEHDESKGETRRMNHVALERQRRSEQRTLFDKLQTVLKSDPRAPRLRLLSLALKEIRNLVETSKYLEQQKKSLIQMQSVYMKQLSLLSGKSEKLIKNKLKEICERQKIREKTMKWRLYFSNLLQSRAALLQAITPEEKLQPTSLEEPDFFMTPPLALPHKTTALKNVHELMSLLQPKLFKGSAQSHVHTHKLTPLSMQKAASVPAKHHVTVAPSQVASLKVGQPKSNLQDQQKIRGSQAQISTPNSPSQGSMLPATLQITAAPDATSTLSSKPKTPNPSAHPPQPFTLPLIRSKTGRIILPSSLKPTGKGFYTLTIMNPKQNGEESEPRSSTNIQPSNVDLSKNKEKSLSGSEQPSDSKSILEEDKTTSSNFDSKSSVTAHLKQHNNAAFVNKSSCGPSLPLQAPENSQEAVKVAGLKKKTLAAACLNFRCVRPNPNTVKAEVDPNPPVGRRCRGRPRKNPIPPVSDKEKSAVVEKRRKRVSESKSPVGAEERQCERNAMKEAQKQAEDTPGMVSKVSDNPVPVKRGRGRPPKKKSKLLSPPLAQAGSSFSKSNEDSPIRLSCNFKRPNNKLKTSPAATMLVGDMNASRPITRGALGKDFPSAKKRSWRDIEKELDPELEFD